MKKLLTLFAFLFIFVPLAMHAETPNTCFAITAGSAGRTDLFVVPNGTAKVNIANFNIETMNSRGKCPDVSVGKMVFTVSNAEHLRLSSPMISFSGTGASSYALTQKGNTFTFDGAMPYTIAGQSSAHLSLFADVGVGASVNRSGSLRVSLVRATLTDMSTKEIVKNLQYPKRDVLTTIVLSPDDMTLFNELTALGNEAGALARSGVSFGDKKYSSCPTMLEDKGTSMFTTNTRINQALKTIVATTSKTRCVTHTNPLSYATAVSLKNWAGKSLCIDSKTNTPVLEHRATPASISLKTGLCR